MIVRIRFPEMLKANGMTPYALSKASNGRISLSTAYRLNRSKGRVKTFDADLLEALCDVFKADLETVLEYKRKRERHRDEYDLTPDDIKNHWQNLHDQVGQFVDDTIALDGLTQAQRKTVWQQYAAPMIGFLNLLSQRGK